MCGTILPFLVQDVAGVAVVGVAARVPKSVIIGVGLTRLCAEGAFALFADGVCTEASWSCCAAPPALAEATKRSRDAKLSAYCTAASSRSACASLRRLRTSGVHGSGIARIRSAAAVIFWLALGNGRGLPSRPSARIRSRATRPDS